MPSVLLLTPAPGRRRRAGDVGDPNDAVEPRRVRLRDRLAARLGAQALDRRLADGVAPERSPALSLRARRLIAPGTAAMLARSLRRLVRDARVEGGGRGRMPVRRGVVRAAAAELDELAARLVAPQPAAARGIAQVRLLLTDGRGPPGTNAVREGTTRARVRARPSSRPCRRGERGAVRLSGRRRRAARRSGAGAASSSRR